MKYTNKIILKSPNMSGLASTGGVRSGGGDYFHCSSFKGRALELWRLGEDGERLAETVGGREGFLEVGR